MPSVKKIELAEGAHINIHALELQALSTIREDLNITPVDFCYRGPLDSLLAQLERGPIPQLTNLNLRYNGIGRKGAIAIAANLHCVPQLRELNLGGNDSMGEDGVRTIAAALDHVEHLTTLNLGHTGLHAGGAIAIASALHRVRNLTALNLEANCIGHNGAIAIADHLGSVPNLTALNLEGNDSMGEYGASTIVAALHHVRNLTTLNLRYNGIGEARAAVLRAAAAQRPGLTLEL
jgi:Ran GTPase-activating protein (RanGAP) involved in mRNA processing and transport